MAPPLLEMRDVSVGFPARRGLLKPVDGVTFAVDARRTSAARRRTAPSPGSPAPRLGRRLREMASPAWVGGLRVSSRVAHDAA